MRGGLCFIGSTRYVKAKNKYMPDYDKNEESNYSIYDDANNLYACSMSEILKYGRIDFANDFDVDKI